MGVTAEQLRQFQEAIARILQDNADAPAEQPAGGEVFEQPTPPSVWDAIKALETMVRHAHERIDKMPAPSGVRATFADHARRLDGLVDFNAEITQRVERLAEEVQSQNIRIQGFQATVNLAVRANVGGQREEGVVDVVSRQQCKALRAGEVQRLDVVSSLLGSVGARLGVVQAAVGALEVQAGERVEDLANRLDEQGECTQQVCDRLLKVGDTQATSVRDLEERVSGLANETEERTAQLAKRVQGVADLLESDGLAERIEGVRAMATTGLAELRKRFDALIDTVKATEAPVLGGSGDAHEDRMG